MEEEKIIEIIVANTIFNEHDRTIHIDSFRIAECINTIVKEEIALAVEHRIKTFRENNKYELSFGGGRVYRIEK